MYFSVMYFFCYQAPNSLGGHSGQFSLHLSHQGDRGLCSSMTPKTSRDTSIRRIRWCHLSTIPGNTPNRGAQISKFWSQAQSISPGAQQSFGDRVKIIAMDIVTL